MTSASLNVRPHIEHDLEGDPVKIRALVAVIALVLLGAAGCRSGIDQPTGPIAAPTGGRSVAPAGVPVQTDEADPHFEQTVRAVEQLLSDVPVPPGASPAAAAPTPGLATSSYPLEHGVDRTAFWTAPLTPAQALAFYRAHPPADTTVTGSSSGGVQTAMFGAPRDAAAYHFVTVLVSVEALDAGVAVRVDAMAVWIPTRPPETLVGTVDSVDVTVARGSAAPMVTRTLTGAAAQRLADAVDALDPETQMGPRPCPYAPDGFRDTLVFHNPGRTVTVAAVVGGCGGATLVVDGGPQVPLAGYLDGAIVAELGLPTTCGS